MAKARIGERWNHTASLLAALANIFRGRGEKAHAPREFHPYTQNKRVTLKEVKDALCSGVGSGSLVDE